MNYLQTFIFGATILGSSATYGMDKFVTLGTAFDQVALPSSEVIAKELAEAKIPEYFLQRAKIAETLGGATKSPLEVGAFLEGKISEYANSMPLPFLASVALISLNEDKRAMLDAICGKEHAGVKALLDFVAKEQNARPNDVNIEYGPMLTIHNELEDAWKKAAGDNPVDWVQLAKDKGLIK